MREGKSVVSLNWRKIQASKKNGDTLRFSRDYSILSIDTCNLWNIRNLDKWEVAKVQREQEAGPIN